MTDKVDINPHRERAFFDLDHARRSYELMVMANDRNMNCRFSAMKFITDLLERHKDNRELCDALIQVHHILGSP